MKWVRSILSIVVGYAAVLAIVLTGYTLFEPALIHKGTYGLLILTLIACLGGTAGGFVAAAIASHRRLWHAMLLGILMMLLGLWLAARTLPELGEPMWYHWGVSLLPLPSAMIGGRLRSKS